MLKSTMRYTNNVVQFDPSFTRRKGYFAWDINVTGDNMYASLYSLTPALQEEKGTSLKI